MSEFLFEIYRINLNFLHTNKYFFLLAKKVLVRNKMKKNYFLVGAQQVYLHKCLQVSRVFFSVLRWGIFVIVDKLFLEVWGGEKKIIFQTEVKKKCFGFFFFIVWELAFFFIEKKKSSTHWIWWLVFSKAWVCQFILWTNWLFFRVSNRSRYLVDRYIIWTDFNNLKYSVGVESLVRHWCW